MAATGCSSYGDSVAIPSTALYISTRAARPYIRALQTGGGLLGPTELPQ